MQSIDLKRTNEMEKSVEQGQCAFRSSRRAFLTGVKYYCHAARPLLKDLNVFGAQDGRA